MSMVDSSSTGGLLAGVSAGHRAFLAALESVGRQWDEPILPAEVPERTFPGVPTQWTPRDACWHVLMTQRSGADQVQEYARRARALEPPILPDTFRERWWASHADEFRELRLALSEPARARAIAAQHCGAALTSLGQLTDSDLEAPWVVGEFNENYLRSLGLAEPPPTVRGLLLMASLHLHDHAVQIRRATTHTMRS